MHICHLIIGLSSEIRTDNSQECFSVFQSVLSKMCTSIYSHIYLLCFIILLVSHLIDCISPYQFIIIPSYIPSVLEQPWEVCLICFVNGGLAAVEIMDPLICWPPSPLQYLPPWVCFLLWINPYTCSPTNKDTDNTSTVVFLFFWVHDNFVFLTWKASRRESLIFNPKRFSVLPYFRFYCVAWLHNCCGFSWAQHLNGSFCLVWWKLSPVHAAFI